MTKRKPPLYVQLIVLAIWLLGLAVSFAGAGFFWWIIIGIASSAGVCQ